MSMEAPDDRVEDAGDGRPQLLGVDEESTDEAHNYKAGEQWCIPGRDVDGLGLVDAGRGEPDDAWGPAEQDPKHEDLVALQGAEGVEETEEAEDEVDAEDEEQLLEADDEPETASVEPVSHKQDHVRHHHIRKREIPDPMAAMQMDVGSDEVNNGKPFLKSVSPAAGSIAGGTTITVYGQNLYLPHNKMNPGDGKSPSSLQPSVRVFLGNVECMVESFESRPKAVKCVTQALSDTQLQFTDVPLPVSVVKLEYNGSYTPVSLSAGSTTPTYRYSSAATPKLADVMPQVAGPSEVLRIHAWSCSGVVEAEPIELVRVGSNDSAASQGSGKDGTVNELVNDPANAWGAVCAPFPPHGVRDELQRATQIEADQALAGVTGGPETPGARGLYGVYFAKPDPRSVTKSLESAEGMAEFLAKNNVASAYRYFIAPTPHLPWDTYWANTKGPYFVTMDGWIYIAQDGSYKFLLRCKDKCIARIGDKKLRDSRGRQVAGWHNHERVITQSMPLTKGWQKVKIVHVCLLRRSGESALDFQYDGPQTNGFQYLPQKYLRAGVSQATVDGLNRDADRQRVGRSPESLVPAKEVYKGKSSNAKCPGGKDPMYVEFFCKVSPDMQPGYYNLKFHDYHYGQSIEDKSAQWDTGMGTEKASVRVVPKVTSVESTPAGGILVKGLGLDSLDVLAGNGTAQFGDVEYSAVNGSQDYIELVPSGRVSSATSYAGSTLTLGPRGLLREFWFKNAWPSDLEATGQPPSVDKAAELITPIEDASGGASGFAERISGVLTPLTTGECRFRIQGTRKHGHETENEARVYLGSRSLSELGGASSGTSQTKPIFGWPGKVFGGGKAEPVDLVQEGYKVYFNSGSWSFAATVTIASPQLAASVSLFEFGSKNGVRIGVDVTSTRIEFHICLHEHHCRNTYWDGKIDDAKPHDWIFGVSEFGKMYIVQDGKLLRHYHGMKVPSQSTPYFHLWMGRAVSAVRIPMPFKGEIKNVKVFDKMAAMSEAFGPAAAQAPPVPSPPMVAPYYVLPNVGQPLPPNASSGSSPPSTHLSTLAENNFNNLGDRNDCWGKVYEYTLSNGYPVTLSGWTHTRRYAKGFLNNRGGAPTAEVSWLQPGGTYQYKIYQYASSFGGTNSLSVNGGAPINVKQERSDNPTTTGTAVATQDGRITFVFTKRSRHVHLSGIALAGPAAPGINGQAVTPVDLADVGLGTLGGAMSFAFTARWDFPIVAGDRIIDFANGASDSIVIQADGAALKFCVNSFQTKCVRAGAAIMPNQEKDYMVSVTKRGEMQVYCDGQLLEEEMQGVVPSKADRFHLWVGRSNSAAASTHIGQIKNLKIFKGPVRWADAFSAAALPAMPLPPLKPMTPAFMYAGDSYTGGATDFDDATTVWGGPVFGAFSVAFTARFDAAAAGAKLFELGSSTESYSAVGVGSNLEFRSTTSNRRRTSSKLTVPVTPGEQTEYLFSSTGSGQFALYRNGAMVKDGDFGSSTVPQYIQGSLLIGKGFTGLLQNVKFFDKFARWQQAFPSTAGNGTSLVQEGEFASSWDQLDILEEADALEMARQAAATPVDATIAYPVDPIVTTDWANERVSAWMTLKKGEEYPFRLERKVAGKTQDTGPTGYKKLGLECKTLQGHPELLPKRSEVVTMSFKDFPVAVTVPAWGGGVRLALKGKTVEAVVDGDVGPKLLSLFGSKCSISPQKSTTVGEDWESNAASSPSADAYCGLGAYTAKVAGDGSWTSQMDKVFSKSYKLADYNWLSMCYKLEPKAVVNMIVKARVGRRNREQWFSIGMTAPNFNEFHRDYKRAAQWPLPEFTQGTQDGKWKCVSMNLMDQIMASPQDYERRFYDVEYNIARHDPRHLANMEIKEIYLGTPLHKNGRWQMLQGKMSLDMLMRSKEQLTITQTARSAFYPALPFTSVRGSRTTPGWWVRWFTGGSFFKNSRTTQTPVKETAEDRIHFNFGSTIHGLRDNFGFIATQMINFDAGQYKFGISNDDQVVVYVDGKQVGYSGCCSGWNRYRWTNAFATTAGSHKVEVHYHQGGGGKYVSIVWRKEGTSTILHSSPPAQGGGIKRSHTLEFIPVFRNNVSELQAALAQIKATFNPANVSAPPPAGLNISLPAGLPQYSAVARLLPPPGDWTPVAVVIGSGLDISLDVGEQKFNSMFRKCPVVRYKHNGRVHSVIVRTSPIPPGFNAYQVFTVTWTDHNNKLNQDMKIYSTEAKAREDRDKWSYCNYNDRGVGYPRDCGQSRPVHNTWFAWPRYGGGRGLWGGASFEIYDGADCISPVAQSKGTVTEVHFDMGENSTQIQTKLMDAGFPPVDFKVMGQGGLRWLDLSGQSVSQISADHGRTASLATNGEMSTDHNRCTQTSRENDPWWTVQLGGTYVVDSVRLLSRDRDGQSWASGFDVLVDGRRCAKNVQVGSGSSAKAKCVGGYGSSLTIMRTGHTHLCICEVEVAVRDVSTARGGETDDYMVMITNKQGGWGGPSIDMSSPMAKQVSKTILSDGTRFWGQVTDYWFRMPYTKKQLAFDDWREYICGTELMEGCAPQQSSTPGSGGTSLLDIVGDHPALLVRPPHAHDGGESAAMLRGRRQPQMRWRLPQRLHTPESLEAMTRVVLGTARRPKGWSEAHVLLQEHAGRQARFEGQHGDGEGIDPRQDPNKYPWSDPASWGGEQPPNFASADIVYIPEGKTALLDMDVYIRFWVIEGNVVWDKSKDLHMQAESIVVNGGQLLIGSESAPYPGLGRITLHGHWHSFKLPLFGTKGIFQTRGNIEMHGIPKEVTWTELETTAYPGDYNITLRNPVDWHPGDLLIIAASDRLVKDCRIDRRDYCQVEERYVQVNHGKSCVITLARPLVYRHVAEELDPKLSAAYCLENPLYCEKTQVRAEVGLLTRSIKVKGSNFMDGSGPAGSEGYGAHIMMAERGKFSFVEFHWMGQAFQMGRYPLHFHMTGLNPTSYFKGCAVHVTFQRGMTIHGTHQATVRDNVIYNHMAHGYFIEDGNEHDNVFENNLGMMSHISLSMLSSDQTPATFWLRNPSNYFRHNHAAGSAAFGFWFDTLDQAAPTLQKEFFNNTAHSNADTGVWVDIVDSREGCLSPDDWTIDVPFRNSDAISAPVHHNAPSCANNKRVNFPFLSTTTWGNGAHGITLFETGHLHVWNHRSVSDAIGCKVWGIQSDNFPDETNDWYGPVIRHSVYHSTSMLTSAGFRMDCGIKTPWDDTLFITSTEFIGPARLGHICPCAECFVNGEGGYQIRTSKLGWHDGGGTKFSPKVFFAWQHISFFFDFDGTLTENVPECQQYGCYLHSPMERGGTFAPRKPKSNSSAVALLDTRISEEAASESSCMNSLVGSSSNKVIDDAAITFSSSHRNDKNYQQIRMDGNKWCAGKNDANQYVEFNFGKPTFVTGIQTKGRKDYDQWIITYKVSYSQDGLTWKSLPKVLNGNRDRNTMMENRVSPFIAMKVRLEPQQWHRHVCMRAEILGCDANAGNITSTCFDRPYLDNNYRNCRDIERISGAAAMAHGFCKTRGQYAKYTVLTANQACCACGGGNVHYKIDINDPNKVQPPDNAPVKYMPGGTGYLDPKQCRVVDETGGIVCSRSVRMQTVTIKNAGIWHLEIPIDVQTDHGWGEATFAACYQQYEFTVTQDQRHMLMPPLTPKKLYDWDSMSAHITMRRGDRYVVQIETIHNPDGYTVTMPGVTKTAFCDQAPVKYGPSFANNKTLLDELRRERDQHSAAALKLNLALDLYKVAHIPLLDTASQAQSAANWGYLPANASYVNHEWYPGMLSMLLSDKGVVYGQNHYGLWNGVRRDITEQMVTRPLASSGGAGFQFSHVHTAFSWSRWDKVSPAPGGGGGSPVTTSSRLEFLVKVCGMNIAAFKHLGDGIIGAALANHSAVTASKDPIVVGNILRFKWSQWPAEAGPKPTLNPASTDNMGVGNVTIQPHWEVTLDEDVDFINKLDIQGVLKFEDKPGCCKLAARYIMIGAFWGRLEAGNSAVPFVDGKAHIVLKGHPMTPQLKQWPPHIAGSAKWLKSKFLAVQGTLSLFGAPRSKIIAKLFVGAQVGDDAVTVDGGDFKMGDTITIDRGLETRTLTDVFDVDGAVKILVFNEPLKNAYKGADHMHLGKPETAGMMAAHVGLVEGHTVVVEGEDTLGMPMCDLNATHQCPYQNGFPRGVNLHDFAKEMRYYLRETGRAAHPNCRPCLACVEMDFSGYIIAMAHFHRQYNECPKGHGVIEASNVGFKHGANINLYHDYSGGNYPYDVPKDFPGAWGRRPNTWWTDPIWSELKLPNLATPTHRIQKSSFNNTNCGVGVALATAGVYTVPMLPVTENVFLGGGVGVNGAARSMTYNPIKDFSSPQNDNAATRTYGVGSPSDTAEPAGKEKFHNPVNPKWDFSDNFLSNAPLTILKGAKAHNNILTAPVRLEGTDLSTSNEGPFKNNIISAPGQPYCVAMWTSGDKGLADNVIFGCDICLAFRQAPGWAQGIARRVTLMDCNLGLHYEASGPDSKSHDASRIDFLFEDSKIYSRTDGSGIGMTNPTVHSSQLGEPGPPDWFASGPRSESIGHSTVTLFFKSEVRRISFVGYNKAKGGVAFAYGERGSNSMSDADFHPMFVSAVKFVDVNPDAYLRFGTSSNAGPGLRQCLQIDCDGRRNSLLIDVDGSLLGQPGTIIPRPQKFYDKMGYVDPLGFDTMEDLIPFPARYDRFGDAIPFPKGVDHGTGGNLEYECLSSSTKADGSAGCDVLFMQQGHWLPDASVAGLAPGTRIVAVREDGGLIRLDALHHGWRYANGYVRTKDCKLTMHWDPAKGGSAKPESQHARRYGRVNLGEFGTHINTTRVRATIGPVYTVPGIWRDGCVEDAGYRAYKCVGGQHRHILIEVMDWNFMTRRSAPVSVEVNDKFAPQGGTMNVLTGPPMTWTGLRVQAFHALGHLGLRHNIYFSADPPKHLRLHLQYAPPSTGVIVCVYYGVPNMINAYVGGKRKMPLVNATPGWDNLVLTRLTPDMAHGTYYYDRVGVETGRPGYLYAVIRGGQHVDFKISHKVQLTSKITVSANWGGWKNASGDNFFNKGLNGLVRNIALLIGAPPSRVKILGQGSAVKGSFWNQDTTSKAFAEWMWKQNKTMAYSPMDHWLSAPASKGLVNATPAQKKASLLHLPEHEQHVALLQTFDQERRHLISAALSTDGDAWQGVIGSLTTEEQQAVFELRAQEELANNGATEMDKVLIAQKLREEKAALGTECQNTGGQPCDLPITLTVDDEDFTPASALPIAPDETTDAVAIAEDENNKAEMKIEGQADGMFQSGVFTNAGTPSGMPSLLQASANNTYTILNAHVDNVPHMNAPLGWMCKAEWYEDGVTCHCDCGIWDPDCDKGSFVVPVVSNNTLNLIDKKQVQVLMNLIDADGNANGVLDGDEIINLDKKLGQSTLFGVAQRIIEAQEKGSNQKSSDPIAMRLGDFAMLSARTTSECGKLLKDGPPLNATLATFRPVCVRDNEFKTIVKQATGRCSLLPEMQVGSQCMVPGTVGTHGVAYSRNNDTNSSTSFVPSPEAVCGLLSRVFKNGQGVGGHRSAGVGTTTAKWTNPGGELMPGTLLHYWDIKALGIQRLDTSFQGGFSFYATVKVDKWESHMPLFSFGDPRGRQHDSWRNKHISVYTRRENNQMLGLYIHTGYDSRDWNRNWYKKDVLKVGEKASLLFTVSPKGKVTITKNGNLVGEHDWRTNRMAKGPYDYMWVGGGAHGKCLWRHCHNHWGFEGLITDIRVWDSVVPWIEAVAGAPWGAPPVNNGQDPSGDLPASCIASRKNTWDFICGDDVPPELRDAYGVVKSPEDAKAKQAFDKREDQGEVTVCGTSNSIKTSIFHGKFGDGLTGEYFRGQRDCNPPFLFGRTPSLVKIDTTINFHDNLNFRAAFNEYAVRWSGKLLVDTAGVYKFKLESKDGSWLSVGGRLVVNNQHCHGTRTIESSTTLAKGGHAISILYFNRGPAGKPSGTIKLTYSGPDSQGTWTQVPQAKLGSAPMRLSKLGRHAQKQADNTTAAVKLGQFVYDEKARVGIMPAGACDFQCRGGNRKGDAAPFKFFCKAPTVVSFVASVNQDAKLAMIWVDSTPAQSWALAPATSLLEKSAFVTHANDKNSVEALLLRQAQQQNETAMALYSLHEGASQNFIIAPSAPSPDFTVTAGEHTILVQGRTGDYEAFALQGLSLEKGRNDCVFFLEGKDKLPDDC